MTKNRKSELYVGLCATCRHVQRVESDKGSVFYLCRLAATDRRFVKYPPLPVRSCPGYERDPDAPDETGPDTE